MNPYIGNLVASEFLRSTLTSGHAAHAYLLTGPPRVGKRTLATRHAAALICQKPLEHRLCGACRSCLQVAQDRHPDVRITELAEGKKNISIDQIRQLEHAAALRPYEAEVKLLLIIDAHTLSTEASNALLKTLEEPPEDTTLILTAADASQVLPTIASRCQEIPLRPVPAAEIEAALEVLGADAARATLLARLSGGRPGWAISALTDEASLGRRETQLESLEELLGRVPAARLPAAAAITDAAAARDVLDLWQTWWRDALLVAEGCGDLIANVDRVESLRRAQRGGASTVACLQAIRCLQETRDQIEANANVRLAMESLLLDLPVIADLVGVPA